MEIEQSLCKLTEYVDALEAERRKIEVFQRELPLCMQLVANAIEGCKQKMVMPGSGPVLEEYIPLKRSCSLSEVEDGERPGKYHGATESLTGIEKPADWLKSVQLWAHDNDQTLSKQEGRSIIEPNKSNGAFQPFCKDEMAGIKLKPAAPTASFTAESGGTTSNEKTGRPQAAERKTRRSWSPELHRRFLQALELLGGSRAATPKQIKELMKVDGLTNDEVKSHLQKYRLNNRRPSQGAQCCQSVGDAQLPQFVVVGGIWVPPAEHPQYVMASKPAVESCAVQRTKVYTPTPRFPNGRRGGVEAHSGRGASSGDSPATSTSSRVSESLPAVR